MEKFWNIPNCFYLVDPLIIKKINWISFRTFRGSLSHKVQWDSKKCAESLSLAENSNQFFTVLGRRTSKFSDQETDLAHFFEQHRTFWRKVTFRIAKKPNLPVKNCVQNCKRPCIVRRSLVSPFSSLSAALDGLHLEIKTILKEHSDFFFAYLCVVKRY